MILLVHMFFGAAIGYKAYLVSNNVWLALFLALASHYFLDLFPHVEYLKSVENSINKVKFEGFKNYSLDILKVALDFLLGLFLIFITSNQPAGGLPIIYFCGLLAVVPDGVTVVNLLFKNSFLATHQKFHGEIIHYLTKRKKFSFFWRISTQAIALLVSVVLLSS